jgi:IS5 family transposase
VHADKGYDYDELRAFCRDRGIVPRIARRGIESSTKLGRHRWIIESAIAWLFGRRRLATRYERKASPFGAFLSLGASLTCYNRPAK